LKVKYIDLLIGVFSFAFIIFGALNPSPPSEPKIIKYNTELDPRFGKSRQLSNAGGQVIIDDFKTSVLDAALGSDVFVINKGFTADRIVAGRDAVIAKDVLEINFPSTNAGFSTLNESEIKGKRYVELGLHYFELGDGKNGQKYFTTFSQPLVIEIRAIDKFVFNDGTIVYYKDILELNLPVSAAHLHTPVFKIEDKVMSWFK